MAIDDTRMGECVSLLEEIFDIEAEKQDAVGTFNVRITDAKNTLKQWGETNEIEPKNLLGIYDQYKTARNGRITWTAEDAEYSDLLYNVMEKALAK